MPRWSDEPAKRREYASRSNARAKEKRWRKAGRSDEDIRAMTAADERKALDAYLATVPKTEKVAVVTAANNPVYKARLDQARKR